MSYYHANRTMCDHVLLIEDDVIASHEWYEKVNEALNLIEHNNNEKWLCLKLFTSFRYYDFFTHWPTLVKMFAWDFILTLLQSFVLIKLCRFSPCHSFILLLNTILIHIWLKCTHISPLGYGLHQFTLGFNAVANVYPREILKDLAINFNDYFQNLVENFGRQNLFEIIPKDEFLKKFKEKFNLKEFILEPSVFQHVGLQSSRSYNEYTSELSDYKRQYKPFQSYSFLKEEYEEHSSQIKFNSNEWN